MASNIEIKGKIQDHEGFVRKAEKLAQSPAVILNQEDTYFNVSSGRLKLRETLGQPAELVHYERPNEDGPKLSKYTKQAFEDSQVKGLKEILKNSLGIKGIVRKTRTLFMVGQTRVHVDNVEKLGPFMELEVIMGADQSIEEGQEIAENLMKELDIRKEDLLSGSYIDYMK